MTSLFPISERRYREGGWEWCEKIGAAGQVALKAFGKSQMKRVMMYVSEHGDIKMGLFICMLSCMQHVTRCK